MLNAFLNFKRLELIFFSGYCSIIKYMFAAVWWFQKWFVLCYIQLLISFIFKVLDDKSIHLKKKKIQWSNFIDFFTMNKILHSILALYLTEWITVLRHIMFYYSSFLLCLLNWQKRAIENLRIEKSNFLCGIIFSSLAVELIWPVTQMRELTKKSIWDIKKNDRRVSVTKGCVSYNIFKYIAGCW